MRPVKRVRHLSGIVIGLAALAGAALASVAPSAATASAPAHGAPVRGTPARPADGSVPIYLNPAYPPAERAADLVSRMTTAEKAEEMNSTGAPAIPSLGVAAWGWWKGRAGQYREP